MLKKFIGKTIDVAKMSAKQMYGDDFVILDSTPENGDNNAGITVMVDKSSRQKTSANHSSATGKNVNGTVSEGVRFERSGSSRERVSPNLQKLRSFAETNFGDDFYNALQQKEEKNTAKTEKKATEESNVDRHLDENEKEKTVYRRSSVRSVPSTVSDNAQQWPSKRNDTGSILNGTADTVSPDEDFTMPDRALLRKFDESKPKVAIPGSAVSAKSRQDQREISALHRRFDKLEALLDSALISSNLEYASHPAFQQLVQAGIATSTAAGWFGDIIRQGVDPFDQGDLFMVKLSGIIRDALTGAVAAPAVKNILFTGPSGSGKTSLIMKLLSSPYFFIDKKLAVVSMKPQDDASGTYYTVLEPFCRDREVPFYNISSGVDITRIKDELEAFDHVLFDSASLSISNEASFREYWKLRQVLASVTPLEVHYVINASMNRFYFNNSASLHHPLQPDFIAITHLDEAPQWGPVIPFLKDMGCAVRYVSTGRNLNNSIAEFEPAWFAKKVLQES